MPESVDVDYPLGIDATCPFGEPFADKRVMDPARMAWARALVDRLGG